jgi:hypothetical protein
MAQAIPDHIGPSAHDGKEGLPLKKRNNGGEGEVRPPRLRTQARREEEDPEPTPVPSCGSQRTNAKCCFSPFLHFDQYRKTKSSCNGEKYFAVELSMSSQSVQI